MSTQLIEGSSRNSAPVLPAKQGEFERDTNDLRHRIVCFLCTRVPEAEALEVEVKGDTVMVRGRLPNGHAKWLCLECCRHVAGVIKLIDNVEVISPLQEGGAQDIEERLNDDATIVRPKKPR